VFPIAHAYLMGRLFADPQPDQYLGCAWPDMLFAGSLTHSQTHRQGRDLLAFARAEAPAIVPFVRAALTHMVEPHGFDWFSDEQCDAGAPKGYAFERARPFVERVIAATHVPPDLGLWKAHNFTEMSFEIDLGRRFPHLGRAVAAACADADLVAGIVEPLSRFFGQPADALARNIRAFPAVVALDTPSSMDLARTYAIQLDLKHQIKDPDIPAMARIIDDIWDAIASDRETFLETCVQQVAAVLEI
jgi:hypothetical protein